MIWAILWASFKLIIGPCLVVAGLFAVVRSLMAPGAPDGITLYVIGLFMVAIGVMLAFLLTPTTLEAFLKF